MCQGLFVATSRLKTKVQLQQRQEIPNEDSGNPAVQILGAKVEITDLTDCPWCHGGLQVSPQPNGPEQCLNCGGLGYTLRYVRCFCGRQVNLTKRLAKGVFYCGRTKCETPMRTRYIETKK
jgi:hypothetical protein